MKLLYLNGADVEGGAAKAAVRLVQGVHALGVDARLRVQRKFGADPLVDGPGSLFGKAFGFARPTVEQMLLGINPPTVGSPFCAAYLPDGLVRQVAAQAPDLIHLHWVARMMRLETLHRFGVPLVWTMHDSWAFTGGCYLPGDCRRYQEACGLCPALNSARENDLSRRIWQRKMNAWQGLNLTVVAPSRWMAECARSSALFSAVRVEVIPNGIDITRFRPVDRPVAREALSLPHDKRLILFGATGATADRNKGFYLLAEALRRIASMPGHERIEVLVFGAPEAALPETCGLTTHCLGWQHDEARLALLYAAADLFVCPSIQESLGYTVMEAMACGTPCVAFRQGGVPDLIDHRENGYLARPYETADLAAGIVSLLSDDGLHQKLSSQARCKIEQKFSLQKIAADHLALYRGILANER